jgi:hypothetical protein
MTPVRVETHEAAGARATRVPQNPSNSREADVSSADPRWLSTLRGLTFAATGICDGQISGLFIRPQASSQARHALSGAVS